MTPTTTGREAAAVAPVAAAAYHAGPPSFIAVDQAGSGMNTSPRGRECHGTARHSTTRHITARHGTAWHGMAWPLGIEFWGWRCYSTPPPSLTPKVPGPKNGHCLQEVWLCRLGPKLTLPPPGLVKKNSQARNHMGVRGKGLMATPTSWVEESTICQHAFLCSPPQPRDVTVRHGLLSFL